MSLPFSPPRREWHLLPLQHAWDFQINHMEMQNNCLLMGMGWHSEVLQLYISCSNNTFTELTHTIKMLMRSHFTFETLLQLQSL